MKSSSFTDFFIQRPVFSWVINIIVVLLGIVGAWQLSTRQYPIVEKPLVTIKAQMDASIKVLEEQVATKIEDACAAIQGLSDMKTDVRQREVVLKLTFEDRSMDAAAADVRDILSKAQANLPESLRTTVTKGNADSAPIMELVVYGDDTIPLTTLHDVAENTLKSAFENVPGVALAEVFGGSESEVKIEVDPLKMSSFHISSSEIVQALKENNLQKSAGHIKDEDRQFSLTTQAFLKNPKEFGDIVIGKYSPSAKAEAKYIFLRDIAKIEMGKGEEEAAVFYNGKPAVSIAVRPQPNANPIEISKNVFERIGKLEKMLPKGVRVEVAVDNSIYVKKSISQVYRAIFEAVILVLLVIFVFLRSFSASLIPLITIPISLGGTFFIMYTLGFTINVLSLLALVLAVGLVVDDAIVVLENVYRYIERGEKPFKAAILGCQEIRFSVIAMTLTLAAVYAPISLIPGILGKLFKEFALTLAGAVLISGFVALTLTPPMCAILLKGHSSAPLSHKESAWHRLGTRIEGWINAIEHAYVRFIGLSLDHGKWVLVSVAVLSGLTVASYTWWLKDELSPRADEGIFNMYLSAPASRNLHYLSKTIPSFQNILTKIPEVQNNLFVLSMGDSYGKAVLKDWGDRSRACQVIAFQLDQTNAFGDIVGLEVRSYCRSSSMVGASASGKLEFNLLSNKSPEAISKFGRQLRRKLKKMEGVASLEESEEVSEPSYEISLNMPRLQQLGISPETVADTLKTLVRGSKVTQFEKENRSYPVVVQVADADKNLNKIGQLFVKARSQDKESMMVPLKELISIESSKGESTIRRLDRKRTFDFSANLKPGYSPKAIYESFINGLGELPTGYSVEPAGELKNLYKESANIYMVFALALLFIFLVMAAQFESFFAPSIIMLSVPFAIGGGLITLAARFGILSIYGQIGLITLIGLITKHGILLVDFANEAYKELHNYRQAILQACTLRLRPILMTTFAMVLGAIPLAFATGPGYEARQQIGWVIAGGMSIGTVFTLFVIPFVYLVFMNFRERFRRTV